MRFCCVEPPMNSHLVLNTSPLSILRMSRNGSFFVKSQIPLSSLFKRIEACVFLHLTAAVVGIQVGIFDVCPPASLLREALIFVFQSKQLIASGTELRGQVMNGFLETGSMPQASLREYFLKHYKGGGVFEARRLQTPCPRMVLDPQELRHQGAATAT